MLGPFLSTLLPETGPAVVELATASATLRVPVEALFVSVPAGTAVDRLNDASAGLARPEPPSVAVQAMLTSVACQTPSGDPHDTVGAFRSTLLPEYGPAVAELPTASVRACEPVEALGFSCPAATVVLRSKLAGEEPFSPEPPSWAVQCRVTLAPCQAESVGSQEKVGDFLSTLIPEIGPAVSELPTESATFRLPV